jgi:pSer/pThr/pTyr-binding forkhead associated (FHA) protein
MRKDQASVSVDQATLVVTYGNTTRKHRPLDRDVIVLGRGRGCDVALVSPEVATVHCLIARVAEGWRLRDCTHRGGTRLNGQAVTEAVLDDGDLLQIGAFSFEVHLPPGDRPGRPAEPSSVRHLQRARRNLAHLALGLRKRLRLTELNQRSQQDVDREADRLRTMQRDWETRRKQQEQAEAGTHAEREARERDLAVRRQRMEQAERELAQRVAEAETRLEAQTRELGEAQRQAEELHNRRVEALQKLANETATPPAEILADLEKASRKLAGLSRRLRRSHHQLRAQAGELPLEQQRMGAVGTGEELNGLRTQVAELLEQLAAANARAEAQQAELAALEALGDAQAAFVEHSGGVELQRLIASLREQVRERDLLLEKMNQKLAQHSGHCGNKEMTDYEEELNEYRKELERDRREMNEQLTQLQQRQQDMEDALREAELQMARERAQIAREQAELNRLRLELSRAELRSPQDEQMRERLAAVRKLKDEISEKQAEQPQQGKPTRARSILNLFGGLPLG